MTSLELTLSKILEKIQSLRPAAVPPSGTASQKNCLFLLDKKSARVKTKNVRAIFLLGSVLNEQVAGLRFGSRAKIWGV